MTEGCRKSEKLLQRPFLLPPVPLGAWSSSSGLETTTFPRHLRAMRGSWSGPPSPPPGGGFWFGPGLKRVVPTPAGGREQQWVVPTQMVPLSGSLHHGTRGLRSRSHLGEGGGAQTWLLPRAGPESLQRAPEWCWGGPWSPVGGLQSPFPRKPRLGHCCTTPEGEEVVGLGSEKAPCPGRRKFPTALPCTRWRSGHCPRLAAPAWVPASPHLPGGPASGGRRWPSSATL